MVMRNALVIIALLLLNSSNEFSKSHAAESKAAKRSSEAYDRECMRGFITRYLDTMAAHKPEALPVAANLRFTENCIEMKFGEGIWKIFSRPGRY